MVKQFGFLLFLLTHTVLAAIILIGSRLIFGPGLTLRSDIGGSVILASFLLLITSLLRPSMFSLFLGRRATRPRLSAWLIFVGVATLVLLISFELRTNTLYGAIFYNDPRPEPADVAFIDANGNKVSFLAYPGQVILVTASDTYLSGTRKLVKSWDGDIIGQIPKLNFYLVEVSPGKEGEFIANARGDSSVVHASPNLVLEAGEVPIVDLSDKGQDPYGMVPALISGTTLRQQVIMAQLDNFLTSSHGESVRKAREAITGVEDSLRIHIGALSCGRLLPALCSSSDQSLNGLAAVIAGAELNGQKVTLNLSWGPVPPKTANEAQFANGESPGANAWALPIFEAYYEQLLAMLNSSEWARGGNVLLNKSAGNGVELHKDGKYVADGGVDLGPALERLRAKFPDVMRRNVVFCGALVQDGGRAVYSNFGQGVVYAVVPADKPGTSFASPQCWGASYNAWKEHPDLSSEHISQAMRETAKPNTKGFAVLDPNGVRSAFGTSGVSEQIEEALLESIAPSASGPACNGRTWTSCSSGYKFYCPPGGGDPSCNPKDAILCNGEWYPPCDSGYDWSCTASGGQCTPTETDEATEEQPLPPPSEPPPFEPPPPEPPSGFCATCTQNCSNQADQCRAACSAPPGTLERYDCEGKCSQGFLNCNNVCIQQCY